jgi:hypothetical protein
MTVSKIHLYKPHKFVDKNFVQHSGGIVIFIDIARRDSYSIYPIINRLSDHDARSITFNTITLKPPIKQVMEIRKINKYTINYFLAKLSYETWDISLSSEDVKVMFNAFIENYLNIFYCIFPLKNFKLL